MPIYEYACSSCEKTIDVLQKTSDPAPETCSACGAQTSLSRVMSRSSFQLKGGGWYKDLYGSTNKDGGSSTASSSTSASSSSGTSAASTSDASSSSTSASSTSSSAPAAPAASAKS